MVQGEVVAALSGRSKFNGDYRSDNEIQSALSTAASAHFSNLVTFLVPFPDILETETEKSLPSVAFAIRKKLSLRERNRLLVRRNFSYLTSFQASSFLNICIYNAIYRLEQDYDISPEYFYNLSEIVY